MNYSITDLTNRIREHEEFSIDIITKGCNYAIEHYIDEQSIGLNTRELCRKEEFIYEKTLSMMYKKQRCERK